MMPIENSFLLKYHVSCNFMLKYYITVSLRQFTKTLNQFFNLSRQTKVWKFVCFFDLHNWMNQSSFEVTLLDNLLIKWHFKKYKITFSLKTAVFRNMIFWWLSPSVNQLLKKLYFELPYPLNFSCTWHKEASYCKILWRFDIILHIWLINLSFIRYYLIINIL